MTIEDVGLEKNTIVKLALYDYAGVEIKLGEMKHHVMIYKLYNKEQLLYKAFCSGSIINQRRILTSSHCFLTNRKRHKHDLDKIRVIAGILTTVAQEPIKDNVQQWRSIKHIYSQKFFRFPAYDLAILDLDRLWVFDQFVNKIPYARWEQDFDGICVSLAVYPTQSWSSSKHVFSEKIELIKRRSCEWILLRSCRLYICSVYNSILKYPETQGGGLICYGTGDPEEKDESQGVLVGVTALININLPSLHTRVGMFNKWITDACHNAAIDKVTLFLAISCFIIIKFLIM